LLRLHSELRTEFWTRPAHSFVRWIG
jgi:hypothetical protein